jgi:hypothetical protein
MLTGILTWGISEYNIPKETHHYLDETAHDIFPFIWNEYEDQGFITSYSEDFPDISAFNFQKYGFRYMPTSLYQKAYWDFYYKIKTDWACHFKKKTFLTTFNQIKQFVEHMNQFENRKKGFFSFNFLTEYSHEYAAIPGDYDIKLREMLAEFHAKGYLNDTMLFIYTDHGQKISNFGMFDPQGKLEQNTAFLSIHLPKRFKNTRYFRNAVRNQNKLIARLDLFQTLKQFLYINKYGFEIESECEEKFRLNNLKDRNTRGISLFEKIDMNRTCESAMIKYEHCNCIMRTKLSEQEIFLETKSNLANISSLITQKLNDITSNHRDLCSEFRLDHLVSFKKVILAKKYRYESTVVYNLETHGLSPFSR